MTIPGATNKRDEAQGRPCSLTWEPCRGAHRTPMVRQMNLGFVPEGMPTHRNDGSGREEAPTKKNTLAYSKVKVSGRALGQV